MCENLGQFKKWLQALALPATAQVRLRPGIVGEMSALAQEVEALCSAVRSELAGSLSPEQEMALAQLNAKLHHMALRDDLPAWSDHALRTSAAWRAVRKSARRVLVAFGWALRPPLAVTNEIQRNGDQRYVQWQDVRRTHDLSYQGPGTAGPEVV